MDEYPLQQQHQSNDQTFELDQSSSEDNSKEQLNYERHLEQLIRNCKLGIEKSCSTILNIMLMNSN
jgi:hypothetical protein